MATTTNFGWETPDDTDLVKDGAAAIRTALGGVDTSFVDLKGGTTGQVLSKNSNSDLDFIWVTDAAGDITGVTAGTGLSGGGTSGAVTLSIDTATTVDLTTTQTLSNKTLTSPKISTLTTNGDLLYGTGSSVIQRLGIGTAGQVLGVSAGIPAWTTPTSGGMTLISSTSLSGTSTTISSIPSGYNELTLYINNARPDSNNVLWIRFNSDSGTNYATATGSSGSTSYSGTFGNLSSNQMSSSTGTGQIVVSIPNYTNTSVWKMANTFNNYPYFSDTNNASFFQQNVSWKSTSAITSITIGWQTASTTSGTLSLYGVK
jgi:hypothetical protein